MKKSPRKPLFQRSYQSTLDHKTTHNVSKCETGHNHQGATTASACSRWQRRTVSTRCSVGSSNATHMYKERALNNTDTDSSQPTHYDSSDSDGQSALRSVDCRGASGEPVFLFKIFGRSGLGVETNQITNHSAKRSGIMSVSNAEVIQWHSAELRADHKCGITSSYQTSPSPQQDGVMGRILSCLPLGDALFNIAPPHFEEADISHIPWTDIVPHFDSYDSQFRGTISFLFASLIFHWNWLQDSMSADHPLWVSKLAVMYDHFIPELQPKLLGGCVGARSILKVTGNSTLCDMNINIDKTTWWLGRRW